MTDAPLLTPESRPVRRRGAPAGAALKRDWVAELAVIRSHPGEDFLLYVYPEHEKARATNRAGTISRYWFDHSPSEEVIVGVSERPNRKSTEDFYGVYITYVGPISPERRAELQRQRAARTPKALAPRGPEAPTTPAERLKAVSR